MCLIASGPLSPCGAGVVVGYGDQDYPLVDDLVGSPTASGGLGEPQQLPFFNADDEELDYTRRMTYLQQRKQLQLNLPKLLAHRLDLSSNLLYHQYLEVMDSTCRQYLDLSPMSCLPYRDCHGVTCPNTAAKVRPIHLAQQRRQQKDHPATDQEINQLRSVLGSLNWVARVCRPDISYELSVLQSLQKRAVVQDLLDCNRLLRYVQEAPEVGLFFADDLFDFDQATILSVTDASYAANFDVGKDGEPLGNRSQSGRMLCLAGSDFMETGRGRVYPLDYHSNVIRRACRSTLQAETLSMVRGYEEAEHLRTVLYGLRHDLEGDWRVKALDFVDVHLVTDCRSLEAHLKQPGLSSTLDKRLAIDMSALRQMIWRCPGELHGDPLYGDSVPEDGTTKAAWVETKTMLADGLTKKMKCRQLLEFMNTGALAFDTDRTSKRQPVMV